MSGTDSGMFEEQVIVDRGVSAVVQSVAEEIVGELSGVRRDNWCPSVLEKPIHRKLADLNINYSRGAMHRLVCIELQRATGVNMAIYTNKRECVC